MFNFLFKKRELLPLPYKREIHCHIIPGVDDGSRSMQDSLNFLSALQRNGVERVVFSPHHTQPRFMNTPEIIQPIFDKLKEESLEKGLNIDCENYSFEYRVDESFLDLVRQGKYGDSTCALRPLATNHLLIEASFSHPIPAFDEVIERLQQDGWNLILAHPERYLYYAGQQGRFYHHLQERQVAFQCNILSLSGYYGEVSRKMAYWMLEQGYMNFLGSDLHTDQHAYLIEDFLRSKDYACIYEDLSECILNDQF